MMKIDVRNAIRQCASKRQRDTIGPLIADYVAELKGEIERLRAALIECGQAAGCLLSPEVSTDFLMGVPAEVRAKMSLNEHGESDG